MTLNHAIYYILLLVATILSFIRIRHDSRLLIFSLLLLFSLVEELVFEYLRIRTGNKYFVIYHISVPIYYSLFTWYYYLNLTKRILKLVTLTTIPVFWAVTTYLSVFVGGYESFPGMQINILGVVLIVLSLVVLFNIDVKDRGPIYSRPIFWISLSTLIFYCGLFLVNGAYSYLLKSNKDLAQRLNMLINNNLNYLYYLLIVFGMICSKPARKYSSQLS